MNSRISKLYQTIQESTKEIEEIRKACFHPHSTPAMYSQRMGSFVPSLVCDDCGAVVPGILPAQSEEIWKTFKGKK